MKTIFNVFVFLLIAGMAMFSASCPDPEEKIDPVETYDITVTQGEGGSFTVKVGSGEALSTSTKAAEGEVITLSAEPAAGFDFSGFTLSPVQTLSGEGLTQTFTMPAQAVAVTALFTDQDAQKFAITVTQPEEGGTFTVKVGSGTAGSDSTEAAEGEVITLSAAPAEGFDFSGFTVTPPQTLNGEDNTQTFTMPAEAVAVKAVFIEQDAEKFAITVTQPEEGGTFTVAVGSGTAGSGNTEAAEGETITLTATPASGFSFTGFTVTPEQTLAGDDNIQTFTMPDEAVAVTAVFTEIPKFAITVTQAAEGGTFTVAVGSGTAGSGSTEAAEGDTITLTATPASGFSFTGFTLTPEQTLDGTGNIQTFTMPDEAVTVTAVFTEIPKYAITVTQAGEGGTFTVRVGGGTAGSGSTEAAEGDTITLAATPAAGFNFTSFTVTPAQTLGGTGTTRTFNMPAEAVTVTAVFTEIPRHAITVTQPGEGGSFTVRVGSGTAGSGNTEAAVGETITLTASPAPGFNFGSFTVSPAQTLGGTGTTRTFTMPAVAVAVTAVFNEQGIGNGVKTLTVVGGIGKIPKYASPEGDDTWDRTRHITVTVELENDIIKTVVLDHELTRYWVAVNNKGNAGWAYGSSWYNSRIGLANFINNANALAASIASNNNPDIAHTYTGGTSGAVGDYTGAWDFHAAVIRQAVKDAVVAINQGKPNRVIAGGGLAGGNKVPWTADGVPISGTETLTGSSYMAGNINPTSNQTPTDMTARVTVTDGFISEVTVLAAGELNCGWNGQMAQTGFRTRWPNEIIQKNAWEDAAGPVDAMTAATVSRDCLVWIVKKAVQKMAYEY